MSIDVETIGSVMLDAVRATVADRWPAARAIAEAELRKLAITLADVQRMLAEGTTDVKGARSIIRMQENAARSALTLIEGISVLTSRRAVGAAMTAAATLINPIIGFNVIHGEQPMSSKKPGTPTSQPSRPDPKKKKAVAATRTNAASTEPAQEATASFKAGKDI